LAVVNLLNATRRSVPVLGASSSERLGLKKIITLKTPAGLVAKNDLAAPVISHRIWLFAKSSERSLRCDVTIFVLDPVRARYVDAVTMLNAQSAATENAAASQHRPSVAKVAGMEKTLNSIRYPVAIVFVNVTIARSALNALDFQRCNKVIPPLSGSEFVVQQVVPSGCRKQNLITSLAAAVLYKIKDGVSMAKLVTGTQVFKPIFS